MKLLASFPIIMPIVCQIYPKEIKDILRDQSP